MWIILLDFTRNKGFRWELTGGPAENCPRSWVPGKKNCPGSWAPGRNHFYFLSQVHCSCFLLPLMLEPPDLQQSWEFVLASPPPTGGLDETASFPTLPFAPVSRLLRYMPALCVAVLLQVPEGTKILTSVRKFSSNSNTSFKKIHSQKPDKIFTAFSSLSTWFKYLRGYFTFAHPVFPGWFKNRSSSD